MFVEVSRDCRDGSEIIVDESQSSLLNFFYLVCARSTAKMPRQGAVIIIRYDKRIINGHLPLFG